MMKVVTVSFPEFDLEKIREILKGGRYPNRNEFIRCAVKDLIHYENSCKGED